MYVGSLTDRVAPVETLTICQATGHAGHPYQLLYVYVAPDGSIGNVNRSRDIVPPYSYVGGGHPGVNWTAYGREVWDAGCQAGSSSESPQPAAVAASVSASPEQRALLRSTAWRPVPDPAAEASRVFGVSLMVVGFLVIAIGTMGGPLRRLWRAKDASDRRDEGSQKPTGRWPFPRSFRRGRATEEAELRGDANLVIGEELDH